MNKENQKMPERVITEKLQSTEYFEFSTKAVPELRSNLILLIPNYGMNIKREQNAFRKVTVHSTTYTVQKC